MAGFLERHGITLDRDRMRAMRDDYVSGLPSKDMIWAGVEETVEVSLAAGAIGALEQRYGESKTTLFMTNQIDASGNPIKDADGNTLKKSGTGLPMSAAGAILGGMAAAFVPMTPVWRRRALNVSTGLAAAYTYRKGIEMGQKWLDNANKVPDGSKTVAPEPPFMQSSQKIAGEDGGSVVSLVEEAQQIMARRRASGVAR